jgi:hypothetical protein
MGFSSGVQTGIKDPERLAIKTPSFETGSGHGQRVRLWASSLAFLGDKDPSLLVLSSLQTFHMGWNIKINGNAIPKRQSPTITPEAIG